MKKILTILGLCLICGIGHSQNIDGFDSMIEKVVHFDVPYGYAEQLMLDMKRNPEVVVLDAREQIEYNTSHIPGAIYIGYNSFDMKALSSISKESKIYVYCSVGYRSGKIAEELIKNGYKDTYNLYGGLFNWGNKGYPMEDAASKSTVELHGYDADWSQWINTNRCEVTTK